MPEFNFSNGSTNIEILKAALPYVNHRARKPMQFIIQAEELTASLRNVDNESSVSAFDLKEDSVDIESMLLHIKDLCATTDQERIDMMLNFIKTQKLYQSYRMFMASHPHNSKVSGFGLGSNNTMLEFLMSQMTPDQKSTFDTLSMMMSAMQQ